MTNDDDTGTTLPRRQLGGYLKDARTALGLGLKDVAPKIQWSVSTLSRVEGGKSPSIRIADVEALCKIYEIDDPEVIAGLVGLAKQSTGPSWWQAYDDIIGGTFDLYVGMESSARGLQVFRPDIPSGLFQTAAYAREIERVYVPGVSEEELDRRIELRVKRQALITRKSNPATIELILQEGAIRTVVGSRDVMRDELLHLADMPASVTVRVLPFDAGFPAGIPTGPFTLLDFGRDPKGREISPPVAYIESYGGDIYLERPKDIERYRQAYNVIQQSALDVASSKRLLRQVAKEFRA